MKTVWRASALGAVAALGLAAAPAAANDFLELNPNVNKLVTGGPGTGRAIYLLANQDVPLKSVGILGDLFSMSYDVVIYEGLGQGNNSVGAQLAIATATAGGIGFDWNDINISYTLQAGEEYIINWRPSDGSSSWTNALCYWTNWGDNGTLDDVNLGAVTIMDGREGFDSGSGTSNVFAPFLRLGIVPGPGALALLGLAGACANRRRRS
jgi:hypothetical protein